MLFRAIHCNGLHKNVHIPVNKDMAHLLWTGNPVIPFHLITYLYFDK